MQATRVCFTGPHASEHGMPNPFTDVRLALTVTTTTGEQIQVPGFFAADGNAANSGAREGDQWCAWLRADEPGDYAYRVHFEEGAGLATAPLNQSGTALAAHGSTGAFTVIAYPTSDEVPPHIDPPPPHPGWLRHVTGSGYPRYSISDQRYLKSGTNSPENLLAFADFDGTYSYDTAKTFVKTYPNHLADWQQGNPTWQGGKGKGLIGALNYLNTAGINGVYFVTNNIGGDARDVWPYVSHDTLDRFDVSKLAQWDIVFRHANDLGIALQVVTQETENETMLDGGDVGAQRSLYYRELVARFGYHSALVWNLGEENGPAHWMEEGVVNQTDAQRRAMIGWFADNDPYQHPVVIHTHSEDADRSPVITPLLSEPNLDGLSLQVGNPYDVHAVAARWRARSDSAGRAWMLAMDEIGPWYSGSLDDATDPAHDTLRTQVLWGSLMAGAYGVEWYYGWHTDQNDLNAEDFRSRAGLWAQTAAALDVFGALPLERGRSADELVGDNAWCLAFDGERVSPSYLVYLPEGGRTTLRADLTSRGDWYATAIDPRSGARAEAALLEVDAPLTLTAPDAAQDWALLVTQRAN